jgi:hypothetical protein
MNDARSRACGRDRALPGPGADHPLRAWERQRRRRALGPRGERAAGVIEVQVRQHDHVDVRGLHPEPLQVIEQHVPALDDAEPLAHRRREERADAGLEQDRAPAVAHQQAPTRQRDAVGRVGRDPLLPHRPRRVAEHRASIEPLRVAEDRVELHGRSLPRPR